MKNREIGRMESVRSIIRFSLNNKFALWMMTLIVTIAGLYAGLNMKQESLPNLSFPYLTVTTIYPGAAPEGVVKEVTAPLEQRLGSISSIKNITSTSMENVSNLILEFNFGQDMDKAASEIREAIADVKLPEGAQQPDISKFSFNSFPVVSLSVSDRKDSSLENLTGVVENDLVPELQGIEGVASVQVAGQYVQEVRLTYDKEKMAQLGLTENTVRGIVQGASVKAPLGLFEIGRSEKAVVVDGRITTLDDLRNLEIPLVPASTGAEMPGAAMQGTADQGGQGPQGLAGQAGAAAQPNASVPAEQIAPPSSAGLPTVKLGDIAKIERVGQAESISRTNGRDSIGIQIVKDNSGETLSVSALMGALMLIGIVVTNAIVLIDRVIHKEREGLSTREALLEAGGTRLRPILMTALATIGALLPLAFGLEGAGIISRGLGVTVIGGLVSSTLLTLVIVPIVYETLSKWSRKQPVSADA
jgi:HAE1 family hydrophobic/amphiphilic exporter-1